MLARGVLARRHASTPAGVVEVLGRPRVHRVLWFTLWSAAAGTALSVAARPARGVRAAPTGRCPADGVVRALLLVPFVLPTVVVGVAFRQLLGEGGPLGFLGLDQTAGRRRRRPGVLQRRRRDPRRRRARGSRSTRGRRRPRRRSAPRPWQVLRTVTLPALRPAIVSAASVVFLFCATAFGIVLTLGGVPLRDRRDRDLPADHQRLRPPGGRRAVAAAARWSWSALLLTAQRLRAVPDPTVSRSDRPTAPARSRRPAGARDDPARCWLYVAAPDRHARRRVAARRRRLEPGELPRPHHHAASEQALLVPVTDALAISLRTAVDATWMSLSHGAAGRASS